MSQWQGPDDAGGQWVTPGSTGPGDPGPRPPAPQPPPGQNPPGQNPPGQNPPGQVPSGQHQWGTPPGGPPSGWSTGPDPAWGRPASAGAPQPGIVPLRPLSLGEIWDGAFRAFRQNPKVMVGLSAVVVGAVSVVQLVATLLVSRDLVGLTSRLEAGSGDPAEIFGAVQRTIPVIVGTGVLQAVAVLVLNGMLIVSVSRSVLGRTIGLGELWGVCRRRLPALVVLSLIITLATTLVGAVTLLPGVLTLVAGAGSGSDGTLLAGVGLALLGVLGWLVGGLYLWVKWSLAAPAMLLENLGILPSLRRSFRLTRRSFWRLLGILLLSTVIVSVVVFAVATPFSLVGGLVGSLGGTSELGAGYVVAQVLNTLGTLVGSLVAYPFLASVTALLYVDLRMRREGLDVELHRAAADGPAPGW